MKRWLIGVVAALAVVCSAFAAEMVTQAKTITAVTIPTGKDVRAMFTGLKPEALQMGLGEVVLIGANEYLPQADATTRVTIRWHTIGLTNSAATQMLRMPLSSQFRTADKSLPPGTIINVRGDLDSLAEDFLALKQKLAKESPKDTVKQVNNKTSETERSLNELSSSGSGSGTGSNYGNAPYSTNNNEMSTDMITTSWQDCQPRIDRTAGTVYQQQRKIETTESGRLMNTGTCEDHGTTSPIVRTYDGVCPTVVDVANRKVFHQYSETATINGTTVPVSACTADFNKFDTINGVAEGCGYRHDFTAGKSIVQEKLVYNDAAGKLVEVRGCGDSTTAYAQYATRNTCSPTIDSVNKQAFYNERVAFMDGNGAEQYATECKPDGKGSVPIKEEFCTPKYEHDFVNHVSYYRTRAYYTDTAGNNVYISQCSRSSADSFPHILETGSCGVRNDDTNKMTYWSKLTQINSPTDGLIEIAPCKETTSPTPYAYVGRVNGATSTQQANTFRNTWASLADRLPGVEWSSGKNTFAFASRLSCTFDFTSWCGFKYQPQILLSSTNSDELESYPAPYTVTQGFGLVFGSPGIIPYHVMYHNTSYEAYENCPSYGGHYSDRITRRPYLMRYLRGDGTNYDFEDGAHYQVQIACYTGGSLQWQQ